MKNRWFEKKKTSGAGGGKKRGYQINNKYTLLYDKINITRAIVRAYLVAWSDDDKRRFHVCVCVRDSTGIKKGVKQRMEDALMMAG